MMKHTDIIAMQLLTQAFPQAVIAYRKQWVLHTEWAWTPRQSNDEGAVRLKSVWNNCFWISLSYKSRHVCVRQHFSSTMVTQYIAGCQPTKPKTIVECNSLYQSLQLVASVAQPSAVVSNGTRLPSHLAQKHFLVPAAISRLCKSTFSPSKIRLNIQLDYFLFVSA